jgi:putative nucleotidyltransferase with HDIG domain
MPHLRRQPVPSGSFIVSGKKNEILEAYLGSCVGVTLRDREANVGGLIHLLLPEPTGADKDWHPENYASTGMPLFIRALCEAGASKSRLEACIAGGALVGPVSEMDLDLDIGGRTDEIVKEILALEGIPVLETETGGFFTCRLSLDLRNWESRIAPLGNPGNNVLQGPTLRPSQMQLEKAMEEVKPIPQIALKITRMIHDLNHSLQDMADDVRQDQVISAKVIRLCHSALFGSRMAIDSIDRALVMLGEKQFLQLVVSASLENFYPENGQGYSLCKGGVYKHALGTALVCERLAGFTGKIKGDIAYTAGLLHDIGKVVLDQYVAAASPLFYRRSQLDGMDLIAVEEEQFGVTHPEVGGRLAQLWSLPEILTDVIRHHHHPERSTVNPELTHLVYLADLLMSRFLVGQELERLDTKDLVSRLQKVGIASNQLPKVVDSIPRQVFNKPSLYSR